MLRDTENKLSVTQEEIKISKQKAYAMITP